jgi:hypothetical protein
MEHEIIELEDALQDIVGSELIEDVMDTILDKFDYFLKDYALLRLGYEE